MLWGIPSVSTPSITGNFTNWICPILRWRTAHSTRPKRNLSFSLTGQPGSNSEYFSLSNPNEKNSLYIFSQGWKHNQSVNSVQNMTWWMKSRNHVIQSVTYHWQNLSRLILNSSPSCALELKRISYNEFLWNTSQCKNMSGKLVKMVPLPTAKVGHSQIHAQHVTIWANLKKINIIHELSINWE